MNLVYEFTMRFAVNVPPGELESLSVGRRLVYSAESGSIDGERIKAKFASGVGTTLIGADRFGNFEIRARFITDDNAALYLTFEGFLEFSDKAIRGHAPGASTEFGDPKIHITVRLESDHPKYSWVNHTVFVGEGRFAADGFEYKVYRLD